MACVTMGHRGSYCFSTSWAPMAGALLYQLTPICSPSNSNSHVTNILHQLVGCRLSMPLTQKENIRLTNHAGLLHGLAQIRRLGEGLCSFEVLRFKQEDHLIWIIDAAQQIFLSKARFLTGCEMSIINGFPLGKISDVVTNKKVCHAL